MNRLNWFEYYRKPTWADWLGVYIWVGFCLLSTIGALTLTVMIATYLLGL
jgi:hypothetical protein